MGLYFAVPFHINTSAAANARACTAEERKAEAADGLIRRRRRLGSLPRSFLSPFALVIPPFRRHSHPKEGSLVCLFSSLARE